MAVGPQDFIWDSVTDAVGLLAVASGVLVRVSVDALARRDPRPAERVKAADDRIDQLEIEIDERAMELLALQQPMARDLRQVVATLKAANDLERYIRQCLPHVGCT